MSTTTNVVEYPDMGFVSTCGFVRNTFSHNVASKMPATHKSNYCVTHSAVAVLGLPNMPQQKTGISNYFLLLSTPLDLSTRPVAQARHFRRNADLPPHGLPKQPITAGPILGPRVRAAGTKRPSGTHISAQMTSSYSSFGKKGDPLVSSSHNPAG